MGLLRAAPTERVRSLPELMAVAHAMESEAAARYTALAEHLRQRGNPATVAVLEQLAAEERGHVVMVDRLSQGRIGKAPDLGDITWETWPEVFDEESIGASRLVTPYQALSVAVRNEERAFAFWSYISAHAEDPEVRREAEHMAREELDHVAKLRRERRRAFHEARGRAAPVRSSTEDFEAQAARTAAALVDLCRAVALRLAAQGHPAAELASAMAREQATQAGALGGSGGAHGRAARLRTSRMRPARMRCWAL